MNNLRTILIAAILLVCVSGPDLFARLVCVDNCSIAPRTVDIVDSQGNLYTCPGLAPGMKHVFQVPNNAILLVVRLNGGPWWPIGLLGQYDPQVSIVISNQVQVKLM